MRQECAQECARSAPRNAPGVCARSAPGVRQGCAKPKLRGVPGVRLGHGAGQLLLQWHMRNRNFVMNFGCDGESSVAV